MESTEEQASNRMVWRVTERNPSSAFSPARDFEALALREGLSACANICLERVNVDIKLPGTPASAVLFCSSFRFSKAS
ncbi:uncharacterized protein G2W53_000004 [Senna tora]|uniref:Uncharacterized protein n=1 Tax=Senna tora TaxID=362788 RepID=A0A834XD94_9FABA|nr:uncharacterized protein G2W53_000004 [Senna tora]